VVASKAPAFEYSHRSHRSKVRKEDLEMRKTIDSGTIETLKRNWESLEQGCLIGLLVSVVVFFLGWHYADVSIYLFGTVYPPPPGLLQFLGIILLALGAFGMIGIFIELMSNSTRESYRHDCPRCECRDVEISSVTERGSDWEPDTTSTTMESHKCYACGYTWECKIIQLPAHVSGQDKPS